MACAPSQVCRKRSTVMGPTSRTFMSAGTASMATVSTFTPGLASDAITASSGSTSVPLPCPADARSERATYLKAVGLKERAGHGAADAQAIDPLQEAAHHADLGRDLRAADDGDERTRRGKHYPSERLDLTLHPQARGRR